MRKALFPSLLCLLLIQAARAVGQDDENPFAAGLVGSHTTASGQIIRQIDDEFHFGLSSRDGLHRGSVSSPTIRLRQYSWEGLLQNRGTKTVKIHVFALGEVEVSIDGKQVLATSLDQPGWQSSHAVQLRSGMRDIVVKFQPANEAEPPTFGLYWSSDKFQREPISSNILWHDKDLLADQDFDDQLNKLAAGESLARALRCAACHTYPGADLQRPAPELQFTKHILHSDWLLNHLTSSGARENAAQAYDRRMPHFGLQLSDASAIAAALSSMSVSLKTLSDQADLSPARPKESPDAQQGAILFASLGCLACHPTTELRPEGERHLFSGGDLSQIAAKRTPGFFRAWLRAPGSINQHHRMPEFELSNLETEHLVAFLQAQGSNVGKSQATGGDQKLGLKLLEMHRCSACHSLPTPVSTAIEKTPIDRNSDWKGGCLTLANARKRRPGFGLGSDDLTALQLFIGENRARQVWPTAKRMLVENNCLSCHDRNAQQGIAKHVAKITRKHDELAPVAAALSPPALTAVGDKLHRTAIEDSILGVDTANREWLRMQMPKFALSKTDAGLIADYFVDRDRIPDYQLAKSPGESLKSEEISPTHATLSAGRLVTGNGFGCQSCHAIGDSPAPKVDLKARGPNLAMLAGRMREPWFQRWVRNPSRIIPRMEMPAIKTPARGLFDDSLDRQLDALWEALNTPEFQPPKPNPESVVRSQNLPDFNERPNVLTDVFETPQGMFLRPVVIGFANRHNVMFDLQSGGIVQWWIGDTAAQYTRGKTWYWQPGNTLLAASALPGNSNGATVQDPAAEKTKPEKTKPEKPAQVVTPLLGFRVRLANGQRYQPSVRNQVAFELDTLNVDDDGVTMRGQIHLTRLEQPQRSETQRSETPMECSAEIRIRQSVDGFVSTTQLSGLPRGARVEVLSSGGSFIGPNATEIPADASAGGTGGATHVGVPSQGKRQGRLALNSGSVSTGGNFVSVPALVDLDSSDLPIWRFEARLTSYVTADSFPKPVLPRLLRERAVVADVPGFRATQLPLPIDEMPISFGWSPAGRLFMGSLKGGIFRLIDEDQDGVFDNYQDVAPNFPTPYGIWAGDDYVDVLTKFALIRLSNEVDGFFQTQTILSDDWGYSHDYHDWAVGLERDASGNYYMALPCQQDQRPAVEARRRGTALRLEPSKMNSRYTVKEISAGLRFPMGIALSTEGDLFTTDNQGNYNPFNELNHIRDGKRYGFINQLEHRDGFSPAFEPPAINLPHPWTRSVNGVCFLTTPSKLAKEGSIFGPFEGQLIGCEMNGRSLVRMSLQRVGDTYQGAAYDFSRPTSDREDFEGPIVCEIAPDGSILVGSLHDSGWGGGQNTGSIVKLHPEGPAFPGIAEVTADGTGFNVRFTQPLPSAALNEPSSFEIRSYRKIATPAYGGEDQDIRQESVLAISTDHDQQSVHVQLNELRAGFVYEINIDLGDDIPLFPSQAHYTMRAIPK